LYKWKYLKEKAMVAETKDRRINTDEKIRNDGAKRLPHERDESPDGHDAKPRGIIKQAADDLSRGLVDTDLHGERGIEEAVTPTQPGPANPLPDAAGDMRHHDSTVPSRGKEK
jgi:hypothetical protein